MATHTQKQKNKRRFCAKWIEASDFQPRYVYKQLEDMFVNITKIKTSGFDIEQNFNEFIHRYWMCGNYHSPENIGNAKDSLKQKCLELTKAISTYHGINFDFSFTEQEIQIGKTIVFMKKSTLQNLEQLRSTIFYEKFKACQG